MKEPQTFTRPRMYYQVARLKNAMHKNNGRFRIIYPDGTAEFAFDFIFEENIQLNPDAKDPTDYFFTKIFKNPCWALPNVGPERQLERMRQYDRHYLDEAIFLGEI